jgi:hypothetical protein
MAAGNYTINWTDDTLKLPFILPSATLDTSTTSLALTGKNYVNWGERIQEDIIRLLESFASNGTAPLNPTAGQFWYDVSGNQLKMRTNSGTWVVLWPQ